MSPCPLAGVAALRAGPGCRRCAGQGGRRGLGGNRGYKRCPRHQALKQYRSHQCDPVDHRATGRCGRKEHSRTFLAAGSNVTLTRVGDTLTIASTGGSGGGLTQEQVRDTIAGFIRGVGISVVHDDTANTLTLTRLPLEFGEQMIGESLGAYSRTTSQTPNASEFYRVSAVRFGFGQAMRSTPSWRMRLTSSSTSLSPHWRWRGSGSTTAT